MYQSQPNPVFIPVMSYFRVPRISPISKFRLKHYAKVIRYLDFSYLFSELR